MPGGQSGSPLGESGTPPPPSKMGALASGSATPDASPSTPDPGVFDVLPSLDAHPPSKPNAPQRATEANQPGAADMAKIIRGSSERRHRSRLGVMWAGAARAGKNPRRNISIDSLASSPSRSGRVWISSPNRDNML